MAISFSFPFGKKSQRKQRDQIYQMYQQDYGNSLQNNQNLGQNSQFSNQSNLPNSSNDFLGFVPKNMDNYYKPYNFENSNHSDLGSQKPIFGQSVSNSNSFAKPIPIPKDNQKEEGNKKFTNQFTFSEKFEDLNQPEFPQQKSNYYNNSQNIQNEFQKSRISQSNLTQKLSNNPTNFPSRYNQNPLPNQFTNQKSQNIDFNSSQSVGNLGQFKNNFQDSFQEDSDQDWGAPVNNPYNNSKVAFAENSKFSGVINNLQTPNKQINGQNFQNQANFNGFNLDSTFNANQKQNQNYGQNENQLMIWGQDEPDDYGDYGDYDDYEENFEKEYYPNPYKKKTNRNLYIAAFTMLFVSATIFTFTFNSYQQKQNRSAVAGVLDSQSSSSSSNKSVKKGVSVLDEEGYKKWIEDKNNAKFSAIDEDLDGDGLTNGEEFLLQTDPLKDKTCSDKTDVENLVALIDPSNCKPMDLSSEENVKKFSKFINIPKVKEEFLTDIQKQDATINLGDKKKSVLSIFEVATFNDLDKLNPENIKQTSKLNETKLTYLEMVSKIGKYIQLYRSQDPIDRNYATPVHPAVYLDTALKYDVPLKYMLAIARSESRFGTDRFDNSGNLTRPGEFKNIYSLGLDDSGNNHGFKTWEEGVEAFGKWYQRFQKRGVNDCSKWRIYNPNGDYCAKIEASAKEIQIFLDKK